LTRHHLGQDASNLDHYITPRRDQLSTEPGRALLDTFQIPDDGVNPAFHIGG
jgi:hypothetical protein